MFYTPSAPLIGAREYFSHIALAAIEVLAESQ